LAGALAERWCWPGEVPPVSDTKRLNVGIIIFDGVEELDFVGPWEVFTMATQIGAPLRAFTVGWPQAAIRCAKGLYIVADYTFAEAPKPDLVLIPGGRVTTLLASAAFSDLFASYAWQASYQTAVGTGVLVLGSAGLLEGRTVTTNRSAFEALRESTPNAIVHSDRRYVADGPIVTSAGTSAGIDMALYLVGRIFGEDVALSTQTFMEYFPEPPFDPSYAPAGTA
jgi:transcriptional regulator GlxA family with amidase domain